MRFATCCGNFDNLQSSVNRLGFDRVRHWGLVSGLVVDFGKQISLRVLEGHAVGH